MGHINTFVDELRAQLESFAYRTELDLRLRLDHIMCDLYRRYNVERSRKLGFESTMSIFDASAILGAKLPENGFALYRLRFTPWVDPVESYVAIGSGEVYAELLMRQQSRAIPAMNIPDSISYQIWTIMLAINEIKSIEPKTGGATQVMIIGKDAVRLLNRGEVIRLYAEYRQIVGRQLAPYYI